MEKSCSTCKYGKTSYPNKRCTDCIDQDHPGCSIDWHRLWEPSEQAVKAYIEKINEGSNGMIEPVPDDKCTTKGVKYDSSKLRWSLLPLEALQDVVSVLEFGAKKYAPDNWKHVNNAQARYWDAAMRHLVAYKIDNKTDSETGLSHLAHAICCLLFLQHFDNEDNNK